MKNNITVDDKLINKLSKLAKLKFDKKETEKIKSDLNIIIEFVNSIEKIETTSLKPLIYLSEEKNVLRSDNISENILQKDALKNASQKDSDYFKVPTILKK